ncbi:YjfB family protein [Bacillus swezeyi]|uniref:YjfB family protein n=1 Tax=Bacillus swezeyi TaxID=1925020 RepID=UPI00399C7740
MVTLDIAALSVALSQSALAQNVHMSLTKTALDTAEQSAGQLIDMMQAPHPVSGHNIDLKG